MTKRQPKRLRDPTPVVKGSGIQIENSVQFSDDKEELLPVVGTRGPTPGGFIIGTVVGLAGLSGYLGWPLYIIPILAAAMVIGVEVANPSLHSVLE